MATVASVSREHIRARRQEILSLLDSNKRQRDYLEEELLTLQKLCPHPVTEDCEVDRRSAKYCPDCELTFTK